MKKLILVAFLSLLSVQAFACEAHSNHAHEQKSN